MSEGMVIFDVDGTLVDSRPGILESTKKALDVLSYPPLDDQAITPLIGPPIHEGISKKLDLSPEATEVFKTTFREIYYGQHLFEAELYPGIENVLEKLSHSFNLAVATNKEERNTKVLLKKLGISDFFDIIAGSSDNCRNKTEIIKKVISVGKPSRSIMVGDTESDMSAAKRNHIGFLGVLYGYGFKNTQSFSDEDVSWAKTPEDVIVQVLRNF